MIITKNLEELNTNTAEMLRRHTAFTRTTPGSIIRALMTAFNANIEGIHDAINHAFEQSSVNRANGANLDVLAKLVGISRESSTIASSKHYPNSFKFLVPGGRTALQYAGGGFTIPTGTFVGTRDVDTGSGYLFTTTEPAIFADDTTEVFVSIEATGAGNGYNMSEGTLVRHSNESYPNLLCVNTWAVTGGKNETSDEELRFEVLHAWEKHAKANKAAIMLSILKTPDVADVILDRWARGAGSFDAYIVSEKGRSSQQLIDEVQKVIDEWEAFGIKGTAVAPDELALQMSIRVVFNDATDTEKTTIISEMQETIKFYVDNIPIGGAFVVNEVIQKAMGISEKVKDIVIYAFSVNGSHSLLRNHQAEKYEKFLSDPDIEEPITVL